jgi:sulfatase modifying factor 1
MSEAKRKSRAPVAKPKTDDKQSLEKKQSTPFWIRPAIGVVSIILLVIVAISISQSGLFSANESTKDRMTLASMKDESWEQLTEIEQKRIETLLLEGDDLFIKNRLITPPDRNAYILYKQVLEIHPANKYAETQLDLIKKDFMTRAEGKIEQKDYPEAEDILLSGLDYFPDDSELTELQRFYKTQSLYEEAKDLFHGMDIENSLSRIDQIEQLSPNDGPTQQLKENIGEYYISKGDQLFDHKRYSQSKSYYQLARKLLPKRQDISQKINNVNAEIAADNRVKEEKVRQDAERLAAEEREKEEAERKAAERLAAEQRASEETARQAAEEEKRRWLGIEFVFVKGGTFEMGDIFGDGLIDEKPIHTVTLSDFYMSKYEVTFAQYDAFCDATGVGKPDDRGWGRSNRPVINVSWNDAVAFCEWLTQKAGARVRLPTEAEWEYAARSGGKREKWAGATGQNSLGDFAWYDSNSGNRTQPVGQKRPNGLGLYDMTGNAWEWCSDWYGFYSSGQQTNPPGPSSGIYRVTRGGSWFNSTGSLRCSTRSNNRPVDFYYNFGFRICREP